MNEAMSQEAMLAALRDVRLPAEAKWEALADICAVLGLAGLALLLLACGVQLVSTRLGTPNEASLEHQIDALTNLPEPQRRVALLHILKAQSSRRFEKFRTRLYRCETAPTCEEIIAELRSD